MYSTTHTEKVLDILINVVTSYVASTSPVAIFQTLLDSPYQILRPSFELLLDVPRVNSQQTHVAGLRYKCTSYKPTQSSICQARIRHQIFNHGYWFEWCQKIHFSSSGLATYSFDIDRLCFKLSNKHLETDNTKAMKYRVSTHDWVYIDN